MSSRKEITEAEVRRAVQKALKTMLKEIEDEPTLVIDPDGETNLSDEAVNDIRKWLFEGRQNDGHSSCGTY
jgi:hypothetical protein